MTERPNHEPEDARAQERTDEAKRESGRPGGGAGRRDRVGESGVFPASGGTRPSGEGPSPDATTRAEPGWGQGERGAEGYEDAGGSELTLREGELLGGLTAGPSGEPTMDIHGSPPARAPDAAPADARTPEAQEADDETDKA